MIIREVGAKRTVIAITIRQPIPHTIDDYLEK